MFSISQRTMLVAAVFAATTGAAMAQSVDAAQVRAEAAGGNKAGLVARGEIGMPEPHKFVSTASAAEVRAEGAAAHAAHQNAHGDQGAPEPVSVSTRSRADVKAEAVQAVKSGHIPRGEVG